MERAARHQGFHRQITDWRLPIAGILVLLPSCLMFEFGLWDGYPFGDEREDGDLSVSEEVRECCRELVVEGVDYQTCIDHARRGTGPCAPLQQDAGADGAI